MTLSIANAVNGAVSLVNNEPVGAPNHVIIADLPGGIINVPKHKRTINSPGAQVQNLAGPNWNGAPMLTGHTYDSPQAGGRARSISIRNMHAADDLEVSFDRGANFFTCRAGESFSDEVSLQFFTVRRSTATGNPMRVEIMVILG
jgi:hypothetical protein